MGPWHWYAVAVHAALCIAAGAGVLCLRREHDPLLHNWAGCYLAGELLLTVFVLATGFLPVGLTGVLLAMAVVGVVAGVAPSLRRGAGPLRGAGPRPLLAIGLALLWLLLFPQLLMTVQLTVPYEWDARSIWLMHGKALLHGGGLRAAFFCDPHMLWSHVDYPLLIPAQAACCARLFGGWDDQVARAFLLLDFLAYGRLLLPILRARGHGPVFATAVGVLLFAQGVPGVVLGELYVSGQADYHYAMPLALAVLLLCPPFGGAGRPLAVLLAARAAAVKNEGTALVAAGLALCALVGGWRWLRARPRPRWRDLPAARRTEVVAGLAALLLPAAMWGLWKHLHGVSGDLHLGARALTPGLLATALAERAGPVLRLMGEQALANGLHWLLLAWVVLAAAGVWLGRATASGAGWMRAEAAVAVAALAVCAAAFATYVLSPHDVGWHVSTSAGRVLFLPQLLLFALCLFRCEALRRARGGDCPGSRARGT